jgi:hypothetical protein
MRPATATQTSFTAGEIDPRLKGRIEVSRYYSGAALLRNVLVRPQGGIVRRPGMAHRASLPGIPDGIRLIPFAFNVEQTYAFAFTGGVFTVFLPDGTQVAQVTGCPWSGTQAAQINWAQSADTLLIFHPDFAPQRIRRTGGHGSWTLDVPTLSNLPTHDFGSGAEAVISPTRGWPECGTFHQGRLYLAGLRSRPSSFIASKVGDFFNFDQGTGNDDEALYATLDTDQVNAIHQVTSGRALLLMTSGAEHAIISTPPITPKNLAVQEQTRRGIKRWTPLAEVDGATLFVQGGGAALRQLLYQDVEQAWRADLLSLLAPHLIKDPVHIAARKGAAADDADHVLLVNADGSVTVLTTLRAQEVIAFSRWETDAPIKSACALASGEVYFAVLRDGLMRIEQWEEEHRLDASVRQVSPAATTVTGLTHLNGRSVALYLDGAYLGTATVASGSVALPRPADVAEVGLLPDIRARMMPFEPRAQTGALIGRRARVHKVTARVHETGAFLVEGQPAVLRAFGTGDATPLDTAPPLLSGDITLRGLVGWRERIELEVSQPEPGPFHLLALAYDAIVQT